MQNCILWADHCKLSKLDLSACPELIDLSCADNLLTSLDVSSCSDLNELDASDNPLDSIDLSNQEHLSVLWVGNTKLKELYLKENTQLEVVYWKGSPVKEITLRTGYPKSVIFEGEKTKVHYAGTPVEAKTVAAGEKIGAPNCTFADILADMKEDLTESWGYDDETGKEYHIISKQVPTKLTAANTDFSSLLLQEDYNYGYIGQQMKCLDISITAVKKDATDPKVYHLEGFSLVGGNKRLFRGTVQQK